MSTPDKIVEQAAEFIWEFIHGNWGAFEDVQELAAGLAGVRLLADEFDVDLRRDVTSWRQRLEAAEAERDAYAKQWFDMWTIAHGRLGRIEAVAGICDEYEGDQVVNAATMEREVRAAITGGAE